MMLPLPLHQLHERLGASFGEGDGYRLPRAYGDPAAEHAAVRARAGVIDRSHRGLLQVTGRDRVAFLHAMLANDVKALAPGRGCPSALLDVQGRVLSLLVVHALGDRVLLETDHLLTAPTLAALDRFLISERVELEDASGTSPLLTVAGPASGVALEEVLERTLPELATWQHSEVAWDDAALRVVRSEESGEQQFDLWVSGERAVAAAGRLLERLVAAGVPAVGRAAWNVLRVEAGTVWHGADVDAGTLLMEAPLASCYSLSKGCYLGQEVVARITYRGHVNRKIVGLAFPDERVPGRGAAIRVGGQEVGRVTSAVVSPASGRGLALGVLRREHWEPGTAVEVQGGDPTVPWDGELALRAVVAELPFHHRARSAA